MAETYWTHFGRDYTYGLVIDDRLTGVVYWLDSEVLDEDEEGNPAVADAGWYWVPADQPEHRHRVARGLEPTVEMSEEEITQTVEDALVAVSAEMLRPRRRRGGRDRRKGAR